MSSSDQGQLKVTSIEHDGVRLINALEFLDVKSEGEGTQVEICEQCGIPHCEPGGWVVFKKLGDTVVWAPAWDLLRGELGQEFRPPRFLGTKGPPMFTADAWERLRTLHDGLPAQDTLESLDSQDLIRLVQQFSPDKIMGAFPAVPKLDRDQIADTQDRAFGKEADEIDQAAQYWNSHSRTLAVVIDSSGCTPIELSLISHSLAGWTAFRRNRDREIVVSFGNIIFELAEDAEARVGS